MKRLIIGAAVSALLCSTSALAGDKKLYVKTKDAKLLEKPDLKAKAIGTLKYGQEVTWKGADKAPFHKIEADGKNGDVIQQNLTPNAPSMEVSQSDGKPIDQESFKSSGAATKALSEAGLKYAEAEKDSKVDLKELARGVLSSEAVAAKVDVEAAQAFIVKQTGGAK